jgi:hypothetical protein
MNKLILGGKWKKKTIFEINNKESEMKRLISFVSVKNDFSVELFEEKNKNDNNSESYKMIFSSNCERVQLTSTDLCEICGQIFSTIEKNGKVTEVKLGDKRITEEEIIRIEFDYEHGLVNVLTFKEELTTSFNDIDIETMCFSDDYYKESILELRNEINELYKRVAA